MISGLSAMDCKPVDAGCCQSTNSATVRVPLRAPTTGLREVLLPDDLQNSCDLPGFYRSQAGLHRLPARTNAAPVNQKAAATWKAAQIRMKHVAKRYI